ncbi:MAG: cupin domain-containing protein [Sphingomonas sp.]
MWQPLSVATACVLAVIANGPAQAEPPAPPLPSAFDAKWHGQTVCEPLFENAAMRAARCTFPPGGGHERHFHPPHWGYIIAGGTMRVTDANGTRVRDLKSGSTWWSDGIAWHEAVNVGTTTSVYIIVEPKSGQ